MWIVRPHIGSALRFSQPLSGFLADPSFVALFHAINRSWDPPFRAFPSRRSRTPLGAAGSLAVIHRRAWTRRASSFASGFTDVHAFTRLPGSPDDYGLPFRAPRRTSRSSWTPPDGTALFRQLHLLRSFLPFARPFLQRWVAPPPQAVALGFLPLRSFAPPTPRILDPPGPEDRTRPFARRLRRATRRTVDPSSRVRPPRVREALEQTSSTKHQPLTDWAAPPLDGDSFSHGLEPPSAPGVLTFRASKCVGSGASPQRSACPLEVSCLFASLVTLVCAPALASP
jgi:hypothetical protein